MTNDETGTQDDPGRDGPDGGADLSGQPSVDIGASRPRSADELQFAPGEEDAEPVTAMPDDPLNGIPSVPADVTGEVPESDVTG